MQRDIRGMADGSDQPWSLLERRAASTCAPHHLAPTPTCYSAAPDQHLPVSLKERSFGMKKLTVLCIALCFAILFNAAYARGGGMGSHMSTMGGGMGSHMSATG